METLGRGFRGKRGRVMLRKSVQVAAAGGPAPSQDWRPQQATPDLSKTMTAKTLAAARGAILASFGVLPALFDKAAQRPLVREAQRHLAQWQLQPMAEILAEEGASLQAGNAGQLVQGSLQSGRARPLHSARHPEGAGHPNRKLGRHPLTS